MSNNIEQNMSALYESPAAPARPARRSIHTALLHGSEEKEGDEYEGAVPQTEHVVTVEQRGTKGAEEETLREDRGNKKPASPREAPILEWTVPATMEFLEEHVMESPGRAWSMP